MSAVVAMVSFINVDAGRRRSHLHALLFLIQDRRHRHLRSALIGVIVVDERWEKVVVIETYSVRMS